MDNKITKIYKAGNFHKNFFLLLCFLSLTALTIGAVSIFFSGSQLDISGIVSGSTFIFGFFLSISLYLYAKNKKIIFSEEGLQNIQTPLVPLFWISSKVPSGIKWIEVQSLKKINLNLPLLKITTYILILENGKSFCFGTPEIENGAQLAEDIENITGKKF